MKRQCGECSLCCRLLPIKRGELADFDKPAGQRCPHQKHHKGCTIYAHRPLGCRIWQCQWLRGVGTENLRRPDHAGYVLDVLPDYIELQDPESGVWVKLEVVQVWLDKKRPDAWREDEALHAYLERLGKRGIGALMRWDARDAFLVLPPSMTGGYWHEQYTDSSPEGQHIGLRLLEGLAEARSNRQD